MYCVCVATWSPLSRLLHTGARHTMPRSVLLLYSYNYSKLVIDRNVDWFFFFFVAARMRNNDLRNVYKTRWTILYYTRIHKAWRVSTHPKSSRLLAATKSLPASSCASNPTLTYILGTAQESARDVFVCPRVSSHCRIHFIFAASRRERGSVYVYIATDRSRLYPFGLCRYICSIYRHAARAWFSPASYSSSSSFSSFRARVVVNLRESRCSFFGFREAVSRANVVGISGDDERTRLERFRRLYKREREKERQTMGWGVMDSSCLIRQRFGLAFEKYRWT